ncbi:MAG: peroxidase, partial [Acidobacteria bacterium]|nr:peroxidase [Acidobacteriota bacterium]
MNRFLPWHRLPKLLGVVNLVALRDQLRDKNMVDTYSSPDVYGTAASCPMAHTKYQVVRHSDGLFNDLEQPRIGCAGMRFGRNIPRAATAAPSPEALLTPNPRVISERLLARRTFIPAPSLNLLAAAWIQFMVHDWFAHYDDTTDIEVPLAEGDSWSEEQMRVHRTLADAPLADIDRTHPAYRNKNTHWWDGSQIYGSSEAQTQALRGAATGGRLLVEAGCDDSFLPRDARGIPISGFVDNWWTGLELMHTLFALEHNAICDHLAHHYPAWTSDQLFDTARLVNCALMAKIHALEWTPGILAHPTLEVGMRSTWWGLAGETLKRYWGRVSDNETIAGIPGSATEMHDVPYALTEEFVSVYRLHPLLPDEIAFHDVQTGRHQVTLPMTDIVFERARRPMDYGATFSDLFYSFGIAHPGAITIHNYPAFLRDIRLPDGKHLDMATVDILRDRERGVPRYNAFRRLFHMPPAKSFEALTGGRADLAREVSQVYDGDIEQVDLLVGCLCEPLPPGFGFSDTAFRVFILMASRRLNADRFLAADFRPDIYT